MDTFGGIARPLMPPADDRTLIDRLLDGQLPRQEASRAVTLERLLAGDIARIHLWEHLPRPADQRARGALLRDWRAACRDRYRRTPQTLSGALDRIFDRAAG